MEDLINLHLPGMNNIGDEVCSPSSYFDWIPKGEHIKQSTTIARNVIYGGGAISAGVMEVSQGRLKDSQGFLWGVGATKRTTSHIDPIHPKYPENIILKGVRDFNLISEKGFEFVPCVSCMSPLFDKSYTIDKEIVYYGHNTVSPMQGMNNNEPDFEKVIAYLASGETVVSSSYHGVYWALLLGRKVICIPFGTKFYGFKHKPGYYDQPARSYSGLLEEYRSINLEYAKKVKNLLK